MSLGSCSILNSSIASRPAQSIIVLSPLVVCRQELSYVEYLLIDEDPNVVMFVVLRSPVATSPLNFVVPDRAQSCAATQVMHPMARELTSP